jgi:hypothetical protein
MFAEVCSINKLMKNKIKIEKNPQMFALVIQSIYTKKSSCSLVDYILRRWVVADTKQINK